MNGEPLGQGATHGCHQVRSASALQRRESFLGTVWWRIVVHRGHVVRKQLSPCLPLFLVHQPKIAGFELLDLLHRFPRVKIHRPGLLFFLCVPAGFCCYSPAMFPYRSIRKCGIFLQYCTFRVISVSFSTNAWVPISGSIVATVSCWCLSVASVSPSCGASRSSG